MGAPTAFHIKGEKLIHGGKRLTHWPSWPFRTKHRSKNIHKGIAPQMMHQHVFLDKIQKIPVCKGCNKMHVLFHSVRCHPHTLRGISNPCQHSIMSHSFARLFLQNFYRLKSKNNLHQTIRAFLSSYLQKTTMVKWWLQTHPKNMSQQGIFTTFGRVNCNMYNV